MKIKKNIILGILPVILFVTGFSYGQNHIFKQVQNQINRYELDSALISLQNTKPLKNNFQNGLYHYYLGIIHTRKDKHHKGFNELLEAKKKLKVSDSLRHIANTNYEIYNLLMHQKDLKIDPSPFRIEYWNFAHSSRIPIYLARAYSIEADLYLNLNDLNCTLYFYKKSIHQLNRLEDKIQKEVKIAFIEMNMGVAHNTINKKIDSSLFYFDKSLSIFQKYGLQQQISINYNNQAKAHENSGDYQKAITFFQKTNSINLEEYDIKTRAIYYKNQLISHKQNNDPKRALEYAEKLLAINDTIDNQSQNNAIIDAENKYRAAEKEKQILIEQKENQELQNQVEKEQREQQILWIGSISMLILGSSMAFLLYKNTKRKQRIAEQEREIEIQKTEKLLKEQELTAIDAMISGQEKERQRLANELHDNLGSTLATVKLHFQHLQHHKDNPKVEHVEELYTKTNALLDEAYQKVRTIAHEKNSGVMANQGLLPAVKKLAKKVSNGDGLYIEVQDYGLQERLDNALEISIFRMIQELITNTIKHAEASEIHISLTNHDSLLNIILEDNGKGFDAKVLPKKEGMGLRNIEKRVEHLQGTFEIDSTIGKGTNIIINIPI
ncbi:sensor histidine kinase [Aquimarina sp. Aq78]|uniref:ATP-binding protein n=1 Tax=Aquimarina sp. Aq78 TaxID=1191889 RepID=UPI000D114611|nr:sensor histidine kinase [Aquimarina sp. Aq78]